MAKKCKKGFTKVGKKCRAFDKLGKLSYSGGAVVFKDINTGEEFIKTKKGFTKIIPPKD